MLILFLLLSHPSSSGSSRVEGPTGADEINVWLECKVDR